MKTRNILFLTGTRADFGKLKPLMRRVDQSKIFNCQIFATGMHTLPRYGLTVNEIYKEKFSNVYSYINQDGLQDGRIDLVLANTVQGLGNFVQEYPPDLLVVHGDRVEALAGAIVGAFNNILTAHVEGGELSGMVDELIRHAVTKLSHIHFVSNETSYGRIIQLGEKPTSVFIIGSPDIDIMLSNDLPTSSEVKRKYDIGFEEYFIFVYHPSSTDLSSFDVKVREVFDALKDSPWNYVIIYPNNDPGSQLILNEIEMLKDEERFRIIPSMRFEYFLSLLRGARAIVGNSSAGIHEAPVYGIPTINIGERQHNRWHHESITHVDENKTAILNALGDPPECFTPSLAFGKGNSAELFMNVLEGSDIWEINRQKQFIDLPS